MYRGLTVAAVIPVLDEERKIGEVLRRIPRGIVDLVIVVDDGSTDQTPHIASACGAEVLQLEHTLGVGAALRVGYEYAVRKGVDVVVTLAGNNKDWPEEIPLLLNPLASDEADLVQGSRYLTNTSDFGDMPLYRRVATRIHPLLFHAVAGRRLTDTTNGFRAFRSGLLHDTRLDLAQQWLAQYELEVYLLYQAIRLGYRVVEVPVHKTYPPKALGQTKMKPITGWWSILRPLVLLGLGLRR